MQANLRANHLRNLGVGPEVPVVLLLDRSPEVIVSLLAVLKAGGAYVPLDVAQPKQRLALFLEETRAPVVITQERFADIFAGSDTELVVVDRESKTFGPGDAGLDSYSRPENLAYILFTSGSTGTPKGVMIENRQLTNYVRSMIAKLGEPGPDHLAMVSTFAADLGNTVLFPSLCSGKCLHLISRDAAFDVDAFADYFEKHDIDCLKIVPSHFSNVLTSTASAKVIPRLALILGGESSDWKLIDRIREQSPGCRIINHFGPTETTVGVMTHELEADSDSRRDGGIPLGRPLPNTKAYLLDAALCLAATNVDAGLYIGGAGLARGYMNQAALTAEKFVPDPFSRVQGERLYQTGDLARLSPDDSVRFLGRVDHQIKIRGFRVELGEIEACLRRHPSVRNAVVEVSNHESAGAQLVAYVVPRSTDHPAGTELHGFLRDSLPDYMLPASYLLLESLPLTPNGKIDRNALAAADRGRAERIGAFVSPRGLGEEIMASLWREVLGVDQLSVHDSFLRVGGDSLTATQLVSRVRKAFQVELPVQSIFDAPTISEFTAVVERAMRSGQQSRFSPILPVPRDTDLPLSFAQERLWGIHQLDPQSPVYNSTLYQYLNGPFDIEMFERALNEIVSRHEVLRTTFPNVEGSPKQIISPPAPIIIRRLDFESLCFRDEAECKREVQRFIEAEKELPFDLGRGPLLRVSVLKINPSRHVVLFTFHHIICDGWSLSLFIREMSMLYDSYRQGIAPRLAELSVQYADFAFWQRQVLQGEVLDGLLSYWTRQLSGAPEVINLPADYPRPKDQTFKGGAIFSHRSPELLAALNSLSKTEGVTLFMTLLAAFYTQLYHNTGQEDLVVGTDVANRNHVEVENLMGFFINNLVLRADLSGNPTFRELLGQVRKTALEAYAHQDLPFATLVKALRIKRTLSHTPLFQVLFVLQNNPPKEYKSSSLQIEHVEAEYSASKFDLAYFATEGADGLNETWCYSTELFHPATLTRMSNRFQTLLENIVKEPDARLGRLRALGDAVKKRSERKWSMARQSSQDTDWPGGPS
jgi:amino acid adenylation domain-containing protein